MLKRIRRTVRRLEDRGASAVEYGLLVAAISAVIVGTVFALGSIVSGAFTKTCSTIAVGNKLDGSDCGGAKPPADPPKDPVPPEAPATP